MLNAFESASIITLISDLGTKDQYVARIKASILCAHRNSTIVDISHEIPAQDIMACAWVLKNVAFSFPKGSIHLALVDPTVGSSRKPIAIKLNEHFFIGPDNGLFSLIADQQPYQAFELLQPEKKTTPNSDNFRDNNLFATVCAQLAKGTSLESISRPLEQIVSYRWAEPISENDSIDGWIVHIDTFGNLITNIPSELYQKYHQQGRRGKIYAGNTIIYGLSDTFCSVPEGDAAVISGSSGMLEVIINKGNAQQLLGVEKGARVTVLFKD